MEERGRSSSFYKWGVEACASLKSIEDTQIHRSGAKTFGGYLAKRRHGGGALSCRQKQTKARGVVIGSGRTIGGAL